MRQWPARRPSLRQSQAQTTVEPEAPVGKQAAQRVERTPGVARGVAAVALQLEAQAPEEVVAAPARAVGEEVAQENPRRGWAISLLMAARSFLATRRP